MDHVTHCSGITLKQLDVVEDHATENRIAHAWSVSDDEQTGIPRRDRVCVGMSRAWSVSGAPLLRVNFEDNYLYRHWSPVSQTFVGGDTLLTALASGWEIKGVVLRQIYACTGNRFTCVYRLDLYRDGERNAMQVIENPWVIRLLYQLKVEIVSKYPPEF